MLTLNTITLRIAGRTLLENAQVNLPQNFKVGLIGQNGVGKTTLFQAILGNIPIETGEIFLPKSLRIGYVQQEIEDITKTPLAHTLLSHTEQNALLEEAQTATDPERIAQIHNRLLDLDAYSAKARAGHILSGLGFSEKSQNLPLSSFSGGWRMRAALASVLFLEPDLLLLDEPTNYLDLEGTLWLVDYLKRYPHNMLLISHDRDLLNKTTKLTLQIQGKKLNLWQGNYDSFVQQYTEKIILQKKQSQKIDAKRKHMESFVERFRAKATKAKQAQSRIKALEKLEKAKDWEEDKTTGFYFPNAESKVLSPIFNLENIDIGYKDKIVLKNVNLRIDNDDRIALLGSNGNGKSTFVKLLDKRLNALKGNITYPQNLKIGFFSQHQVEDLDENENPINYLKTLLPQDCEGQIRARIARMGLSNEKMETKIKNLSGGEKARLALGIITLSGINLLILDEPTNHLDIGSREALIKAINDFSGAVILISHDRHFIEMTMERLWLVHDQKIEVFDGDMQDYQNFIVSLGKGASSCAKKETSVKTKQEIRKQSAEKRSHNAELKKQIQKLEKKIETLQKDIKLLEDQMAKSSFYNQDKEVIIQITQKNTLYKKALEETENLWLIKLEEYEDKTQLQN